MYSFVLRVAGLACILGIAATQASACQCSGIHGKNAWEIAKLEKESAAVIFEGTPEHFDFQWSVLKANPGDLIPSDLQTWRDDGPRMIVTFRVLRAYKGQLGSKVQMNTGLGGGDCGAQFAPGLTYLVYGFQTLHELNTSMCSPGGWIGGADNVGSELRYLRNEPPTSADLLPLKPWAANESTAQDKQRQCSREEIKKRYATATGSICGSVIRENAKKDEPAGSVSFLSTEGYSPFDHPTAQVNDDGSFCSERLGPGKYYVYFARTWDRSSRAALYYPGVSERTNATAIEVGAGLDRFNLIFKIPEQKTYSVFGFISTNDKAGLTGTGTSVTLISLDGDRQTWYTRAIDFQGSRPLPKVRFFSFENVVPAHYVAYVSVAGRGWQTRKVEVNVTSHMKFISLELLHNKKWSEKMAPK